MRLPVAFLFIFYVLLSTSTSTGTSGDDRRWLASFVELVEFDYEDQCDQRATAAWNELLGASNGLSTKLERDKAFGLFSRQQTLELREAVSVHHTLGSDDDILRRKVKLLLLPGDTLLYTEPWIRLVTFADTSLNKLRFATDYYCGTDTNCTLRELHTSLANTQDVDTLLHMKQSWEKKLPDMNVYLEQILPLLINSSKENNYETVEQYWDSLAEYEGAILKARELWDNIKPLYSKLHKYVALRLRGSDAVGKPLPVHLLGSLTGEDWTNLIEVLLPKHADVYKKIHENMHLKDLGGIKAFEEAEKLIKILNLGDMEPGVWSESAFNGTCPATLVDWCKPNKLKVVSCKDITIGNYIDAHETAMKIKYKQTNALYSNNTYILREAPRYSAVYEAIPGFASLLALTPHSLDRAGLYNFERFNLNPNHHRLVLQLIIALRDLPKLNYYLAVDEWRLKLLMGSIPPAQAATSWAEFRRNFSDIDTSNEDVLGDPYVLFNRPYIGKFMGLILKYQVYQSFAEELISDESDLVKHVAENNDRILTTMMQGFGVEWSEIVSDLLAKRENGLEYTAITDYFRFLDEYLDSQFEFNAEPESDDYVDPPVEPEVENEIPSETKDSKEVENVIEPETHEDIQNNLIDTDDASSKFGLETSTIGVLEIKKQPVGSADQKAGEVAPQEASYSMYWWVGVAVALGIVIILIAIIARKRHNHRKQLERQRENSCA